MSRSDFDNDGFDDLAIGAPGETVADVRRAGAVNVLFGSSSSLTATGDQFWHQDQPGVRGVAEYSPFGADAFGAVLASGDFDNDGFSDLAVGVPEEEVAYDEAAGAVNVLYGSGAGLTAVGNQIWTPDSRGVLGVSRFHERFGKSLATGDFDNDGFDDLAIGSSNGADYGVGGVNVLYGSTAGLTAAGDQFWAQDTPGVRGAAEISDFFGNALGVGDFDADGFDDLAIGVRGEDVGAIENAGAVNVIRGSAAGLAAEGDQIWSQNSRGVLGKAETADLFGSALAVGDFDNDGFDDLAISARLESVGAIEYAGAVNVLRGSATGLAAAGNQIWTQDSSGVKGAAKEEGGFGDALAVGDFDGDGFDDLAIGAPNADVGSAAYAGAVNVLYGSASGLSAARDQLWHQNVRGVLDDAEGFDFFGSSLTVGDYNDDGFEDLAIGVPGEDIGLNGAGGGAVNLLLGSADGLTAVGDQFWSQDVPGVLGQSGGEGFGSVLA